MPRFDLTPVRYQRNLWRLIEGQHRASTMRIVDTNEEQAVLEQALEDSKPPVPAACQHLDYRLWSPFRYGAYPGNSRFRRQGRTPGVWYGSEETLTAVCETAWGRLTMFKASPGTPLPHLPIEFTAVQADIGTPLGLDLTKPPLSQQARWDDPDDYDPCLALADQARAAGIEAIRNASARHPSGDINVAVLSCAAFRQPAPINSQTWRILLGPARVRAHCETLRQDHELIPGATGFTFAA